MTEVPPNLSPSCVVVRSERTAARTVAGKALVVVIDRNELHTLNEAGSFLWEECDGKTVGELAELLAARYSLEAERARHDVHAFVQAMQAVQALRLKGE